MNSKLIIQLAFLLLAGASINWYLDSTVGESGNSIIRQNDPDLYMINASLTQFDATGKLQHRIRASRFTHYPASDITILTMPDITLYKDDAPPWKIRSKAGRILPDHGDQGSRLELWDSVLVERTNKEGKFIRIRSENLTVLPALDYAETDQTVIIDDNTSRTTASGMKAYLKPGRFLFYSNEQQRVNTTILPTPDQI
ncbi:MAG: LPS export ABC transporter periplasmic protein LptC [Gammaproteobacteria bacterium]|nr:LPS export ABC transporter periplasmic protein LptC [Gammaproteobacteria bacterium]